MFYRLKDRPSKTWILIYHQHSKDVTKSHKLSPTSSRQHHDITNITVTSFLLFHQQNSQTKNIILVLWFFEPSV